MVLGPPKPAESVRYPVGIVKFVSISVFAVVHIEVIKAHLIAFPLKAADDIGRRIRTVDGIIIHGEQFALKSPEAFHR